MSFFLDIISVVPKKLSWPILRVVPTACMLSRTEVKPSGPVTFMFRALPPLDVHITLNFPSLRDITSIFADTDCTGGNYTQGLRNVISSAVHMITTLY